MKRLRNLCLILLFLISVQTRATHVVGGDLNYTWLGGNNYQIKLTVYRDCLNGVPPFDPIASIGVYNKTNTLLYDLRVAVNDSAAVPPTSNVPCVMPPANICYTVAHYITNVNLPPRAGGYQLVYERCCRNGTIVNITNPGAAGATYYATIPDPGVVTFNSNPVFKNWPPTFICVDEPFIFDHSATDKEGDSIVYTLCDPIHGPNDPCFADNLCCVNNGNIQPCGPMPQPPFYPPYISVTWKAPYSSANIFGGIPLTIDPVTGLLSCKPNTIGQFVYGVCAREYRNGKYLGETHRDFQVNILACPKLTVSAIQASTSKCGILNATFKNNSVGAFSYHWDFGDSLSTSDTSNAAAPNFTYPDSGTFKVVLIAYSNVNSACNDTSSITVHLYPPLKTDFNYLSPPCSDSVAFRDSSSKNSGTVNSWNWNFGDGTTDITQNPLHIYSSVGTFTITLITTTTLGCIDTAVKTIDLTQFNADFNYLVGCDDSVFFSQVLNLLNDTAKSLSWNFGDNSTSTGLNPFHTYANTGKFPVSLIITTNRGCTDTINKVVDVTRLKADFSYMNVPCNDSAFFKDNTTQAGDPVSSWRWDFGDGGTSNIANPVHVYNEPGNYTINFIATTQRGCRDTAIKSLALVDNSKAAFTPSTVPCRPEVKFNNSSSGAYTYHWDFGDGTSSTEANPVHVYQSQGTYNIKLVINSGTFCNDSVESKVHYDNAEVMPHFLPNSFTPNGDGLNDKFLVTGNNICETVELVVLNRWGQIIFESTDLTDGWDGKLNGDIIPEGVYVYILKGEGWDRYGTVTVIR